MGKNIATKYDIGKLDKNSIVIDGGGYRGDWCSYILKTYGCKVYVFEPHPDNMARILDRVGNDPNVVLLQRALYSKDNTQKLMMTPNADGYSLYDRSKNRKIVSEIDVQTTRVDTFLEEFNVPHVDLIKLNVEGSEVDILESLDKNTASKIRRITFAGHGGKIVEPDAIKRAIRHARSIGYTVTNYAPKDWAKNGKFNRWTCVYED
jgi:FkbM family methyltransferase